MAQNADQECLTVSVPEAGRLLGISRCTAYELVRIGTIPSLRFGKAIRVPRRALDRMVDSACHRVCG